LPFIERESRVTLSGDFSIGAVEIKDFDTDVRADVTEAGLEVDITYNPSHIGLSAWIALDNTERRLDCTPLVGIHGYPMLVELEAQDVPCWVFQGDNAVALPIFPRARMLADEWRMVTISGVEEAYFATQRNLTASGVLISGVLVATRIDRPQF